MDEFYTEAFPDEEEPKPGGGLGRLLLDIFETILLSLLLFLAINAISARIRVDGFSMEPTLNDGDYVVAATKWWRPRENKLVVANHPEYGVLIKRVRGHSSNGYTLTSDNPRGTDSRTFGDIPEQQLVGQVLLKIRRPSSPTSKS